MSDDAIDSVLAHYGKKGMRWGQTSKSQPATKVSVTQTPGKRVVTKGGQRQPASTEAKQVAAIRQKAKSSRTDSLTNSELQSAVTRMNLEQNFSRLSIQSKPPVSRFVANLMASVGKQQATRLANDVASKKVDEMLSKR